ncbi:MAG: type transport system permease protein [Microbacteriaceae bacterium]|nr:type transport system permease protein [Microbacteriaceae bacterium]
MRTYLGGVGTIVGLEIRQRMRGVAWYVLLGVFVTLVAAVTLLLWLASGGRDSGGWLYSLIVYFVLLLGTLVTPALSGNAINGERDAGTLATTQVTLMRTSQLVLGKFLAAWASSLAFLAASIPFVVVAVLLGNLSGVTIVTSALVLAAELGFVAAIGVGLSGIVTRPLFSVTLTYLAVAALSVGTLIAFGLLGAVTRSEVHVSTIGIASATFDETTGTPSDMVCMPPVETVHSVQRFDPYWGILAANPYVIIADAAPASFSTNGGPNDLFSAVSFGVRSAQRAPDLAVTDNACAAATRGDVVPSESPSAREIYDSAMPSWFVGLGFQLVLAAGALAWAWSRTRTPAKHLAKGSRVA